MELQKYHVITCAASTEERKLLNIPNLLDKSFFFPLKSKLRNLAELSQSFI